MNIKNKVRAEDFLRKHLGHVSFGELMKSERYVRELTQVEMSKLLKISKQDLCNIEKGRKQVGPERAMRFAKLLGKSQKVFIRYSLQDLLHNAKINLEVELKDLAL